MLYFEKNHISVILHTCTASGFIVLSPGDEDEPEASLENQRASDLSQGRDPRNET